MGALCILSKALVTYVIENRYGASVWHASVRPESYVCRIWAMVGVNFCKNHLAKQKHRTLSLLSNKRKLTRLIRTQYKDIFSNLSEGTAFLLQGITENNSSF